MRCSLLKLEIKKKQSLCLKITSKCVFKATVYRVIFTHVILPFYINLQTVSPRLNFAQTHFCIKEIIRPVLNLPSDIDK